MKKMRVGNKAGNPSASDVSGKQSEYTDLSGRHVPSDDEIQLRAYWIHLERGGQHGYDLDDWLQAEQELLTESRRTSLRLSPVSICWGNQAMKRSWKLIEENS